MGAPRASAAGAGAGVGAGAMSMFGAPATPQRREPEPAKELPGEVQARSNPLALEPIKGENADAHFDL